VSRSEFAARAVTLAAVIAIVVGVYSLVPHIRAERLAPVVLEPTAAEPDTEIVVSVSGAVERPGLYTVDASTSLADVLVLAAGNQKTPSTVSIVIDPIEASQAPQKIDLNHAEAWLLDALPGIGPDKAKAIVDYREHHGPFSCTDELTLVPGIGSATYESLREFITVTP
jgi:competence protein ComEA